MTQQIQQIPRMGKTEEDCVRPGSDADLRAEQSRYARKMTF